MPIIVDEATWNKAEKKRQSARHVQGEIRGWLLQGIGTCGLCGRKLSCSQKKKEYRYYTAAANTLQTIRMGVPPAYANCLD